MKLLVLSHRVPYPPNKGEKIRTYHQLKALVEAGHEVSVYTHVLEPDDKDYAEQLARALNITVTPFAVAPKAWRYLKAMVTGRAISESFFCSKALKQQLRQSVSHSSFDAILCTASSVGAYVLNAPGLFDDVNTPRLFMDLMDVDSEKWAQYAQGASFPMSWVYQRESQKIQELERRAAECFDKVYLIARAEVALFHDTVAASDNVEVLGNGLDTEQFYPAPSNQTASSAPTFLFTGVMDYKPNEDAVIWFVTKCWPILQQSHPEARFIIAGMNPTPEVKALEQHQGVSVTGFVDDILACFHQATVFVAPFRLARGVQNKVLQAFACGLPVVSTSMGAEGIDCNKDVHLKVADQAEDFARQCQTLLNNPEQAIALGHKALALIRSHYSWESQLEPLLSELSLHDD